MKRTAVLTLFLLLGGCAKKTPPPEDINAQVAPAAQAAAANENASVSEAVAKMIANFKRVQFEFDSFKLTPESRTALEDNADIMKVHPEVKIEIQGHADERGTSEYNLALGEKRALALRQYITTLGVESARVDTISYGEERPLDEGNGETAWSKNRRAEFRVTWGTEQAAGTTD